MTHSIQRNTFYKPEYFKKIGQSRFPLFQEQETGPESSIACVEKITKCSKWGKWEATRLVTKGSSRITTFKGMYTVDQKLSFMKEFIADAFNDYTIKQTEYVPEQDILKYQAWVLNRSLRQMATGRIKNAYKTPYNLKEIVEDVFSFHKAVTAVELTTKTHPDISKINSLNALNDFVSTKKRLAIERKEKLIASDLKAMKAEITVTSAEERKTVLKTPSHISKGTATSKPTYTPLCLFVDLKPEITNSRAFPNQNMWAEIDLSGVVQRNSLKDLQHAFRQHRL